MSSDSVFDRFAAAAARYDALHADQTADVEFYAREAVAAGGPVLEVVCEIEVTRGPEGAGGGNENPRCGCRSACGAPAGWPSPRGKARASAMSPAASQAE